MPLDRASGWGAIMERLKNEGSLSDDTRVLLADTRDLFFPVFHVWFQANPFHNPAARSGYFWEFAAIPIADEGINRDWFNCCWAEDV